MVTRIFKTTLILFVFGLFQAGVAVGQNSSADAIGNYWIAESLVFSQIDANPADAYPLGVTIHRIQPQLEVPEGSPTILGLLPTPLLSAVTFGIENVKSDCDIDLLAHELSEARSASQLLTRGSLASGLSLRSAICFNGGIGGDLPRKHVVLFWSEGEILAYVECRKRSCTFQYLPPKPLTSQGDEVIGVNVSIISSRHFSDLVERPNVILQRVLDVVGFDNSAGYQRPSIPVVQSITQQARNFPMAF